VALEVATSGECAYGDPGSGTTVVLLGDSHAAHWFPTLERLATDRGWRLVNLTKSGCSPATIRQWNSVFKRPYDECDTWRAGAMARIAAERPALVVVAGSRQFAIVDDTGTILRGDAETAAWRTGIEATLAAIVPVADRVAVIGDTPRSQHDVPVCLSDHPDDVLACATPVDRAIDATWRAEEQAAAAEAGAAFIDPAPWVCPSGPCPAVLGRFMVYRDEHHLTTPFAAALARPLGDALEALAAAR